MKYIVDTDKKIVTVYDGYKEDHKDRGNYLTLKKMFEQMDYIITNESNNYTTFDMDPIDKSTTTIHTVNYPNTGNTTISSFDSYSTTFEPYSAIQIKDPNTEINLINNED